MKKLVLALSVVFGLGALSAAADGPSADAGKRIWNDKKHKCASCHGEDGKAQTKMGQKMQIADMTTAEWQGRFSDQQIKDAVMKGVDREEKGRKVKMKPMEGATDADAESLLKFVRSLKSATAPKPAEPKKDAAPPPAPPAPKKDAPPPAK